MDLFLDDLELFTVLAGIRPMAKKEGPLADALAADPARVEAAGLRWVRDPTGAVYVARDPDLLSRAQDLKAEELLSRDSAVRRAANLGFGRLLGYPECCVAAFADLPVQNDEEVCAALLAPEPLATLPWESQFLPPLDSLLIHYPCRLDCPASLDLARRTLAALERAAPGATEARRDSLARLVIAAGRFDFLVIDDGDRYGDTIEYRRVRTARDFHPGVPVTPRFDAFLRALPAGGMIEVNGGEIRLLGSAGDRPVAWSGAVTPRILDYRG